MSHPPENLDVWHLRLAILADAIGYVLSEIHEPIGLSATAYVLKDRLAELVESCPFPDQEAAP